MPARFAAAMLRTLFLVALALLLAVGGGAGSAWFAAQSLEPLPAAAGWHPLPDRAALAGNPYRRDPAGHRFALDGKAGEKLLLVATLSDDGAPLRRDCAYTLSGRMPPSRFWTIAVLDPSLLPPSATVEGLTSGDVVWQADGAIEITAGSEPAAGNWLRLAKPGGSFVFLIGLYDTPSVNEAALGDTPLPRIARASCRAAVP